MKKLIALLLLTLMVFSLSANAFADNDGVITISNATIGKKYTLYKIFDATLDDTKNYIAYTYSGTLPTNNYFAQDDCGYITIEAAAKDTTDHTHLSSDAIKWLKDNLATIGTKVAEQTPSTSNTVTFSSLAYGYYYIASELGAAVSVNSTTPTVSLIDKNQGPTWEDKEGSVTTGKHIIEGTTYLEENSVNIGDIVNFEVAFNATNYVKENKVLTYYITDKMEDSFEYVDGSLKVYFDGALQTVSTDYTGAYCVSWNNKTFTITAPWTDNDTLRYPANANTIIKVEYQAKLLNTAVIASPGNKNTACFDYRLATDTQKPSAADKPHSPPATPYHNDITRKVTTTYTYAVGLTKVDAENKARLKGAQFELYKVGTDDTTLTKLNGTKLENGLYVPDSTSTNDRFVTDDNGDLVIKGLKEGKYKLKEVVAPNGYNRTTELAAFTFNSTDTYTDTHIKDEIRYTYNANVLQIIFENQRGVALPITGGMGTTIFYIIGGALVFGAVLLLITKKRMSEK